MRTTLTLDQDVAVLVERARESTKASLKDVINEALRRGLTHVDDPAPSRLRYSTPPSHLGGCHLPDLDDVAGAISAAEGDDFR